MGEPSAKTLGLAEAEELEFFRANLRRVDAKFFLTGAGQNYLRFTVAFALLAFTQFRPFGATNEVIPFERMFVSITNVMVTSMLYRHTTAPPWNDGNALNFRFTKPRVPGAPEEEASWSVVNMHGENFGTIVKRLKIKTVEVAVFHTSKSSATMQETGKPERRLVIDQGYAVVIDDRIPRIWFSTPRHTSYETQRQIQKAFPQCFSNARDPQQRGANR
jgi:hypothetical protein